VGFGDLISERSRLMAIAASGNAMSRFLITTADESTWVFDRPVLFLGHWCLNPSREHIWSKMDYVVFNPKFSASALDEHFATMNLLYDDLLTDLSIALNDFHECAQSKRYWTILIGPWLRLFCNQLMFRWTYMTTATSHFEITDASCNLNIDAEQLRPRNFAEYKKINTDEAWGQYIYSKLWTYSRSKYGVDFDDGVPSGLPLVNEVINILRPDPEKNPSHKIIIADSYLPRKSELALSLLVKSPRIRVPRVSAPAEPPDDAARASLKFSRPCRDQLHAVGRALVADQLPSAYLEGYVKLSEATSKLRLDAHPKTIFTSNRHFYDDVFNLWAAQATENGSRYVIGQHGGNYGSSLYTSHAELHEQQVADIHLTWGWGTLANQVKGPCLKMVGIRRTKSQPNGNLLIVCDQMWKHPRSLFYDVTENSGYLEYVKDCISNLTDPIRDQTLVRLNHAHAISGSSQSEWWSLHAPEIAVDDGLSDMRALRGSARLVVTTFNGTTFLETLHLNIPTVITWSDSYCKIRDEAKPYFKALEAAGIFHSSAGSFTKHLENNWNEIETWWASNEVQAARLSFCERYSRIEKRPLRSLMKILNSNERQGRP